MIVATKSSIAGLLNYQDGCIVSRDIIKNLNGGVTLFAFGEGQGLSEHTVPFDALVQGLEGEAEIMCAGQSYLLHAGEIIILPSSQPHSVKATKRFKMMLTRLSSPPNSHRSETKVLNIANTVEYKDGAITHQPVVTRQSGRIFIYAYDMGQARIDGVLLFDTLVQVLEGEVEITVQGNLHHLQANDMILLPSGKTIDMRAITRFKMMQTVVEPET